MKIFVSYGHDHRELGRRVYQDLEALGHQVWFDERTDDGGLKPAQRWEDSIERGIETADWIIALMSPHSMRRPDGVCLDELSYGRFLNRPIVPLMVQMVRPPLCIARLQYIDLQGWQDLASGKLNEDWYQKQFGLLDQVLQGKQELGFEGQQSTLRAMLQPLDNDSDIARLVKNFVGREWLRAAYERWRDGAGGRVFWITGGPGVGKSAFVASLCHRDPAIVGVHFCQFDKSDWRDPARVLQSLAYQLATQLPDYQQQLLELGPREKFIDKDIGSQFALLFGPLAKISPRPDRRQVLIIDALDEAIDDKGKNPLADAIARNLDSLPEWLGLFITSRPEADLRRRLSALQPTILDTTDTRNLDDIAAYLTAGLTPHVPLANLDNTVSVLKEKSEGTFLYASEILRAVAAKELDPTAPETFPSGLTGIYLRTFERYFPDIDHYRKYQLPILELIACSFEALPVVALQWLLQWDNYSFNQGLRSLGTLFPVNGGNIRPAHKSLIDWCQDAEASGEYWVDASQGHKTYTARCWSKLTQNPNKLDDHLFSQFPRQILALEDASHLSNLDTIFTTHTNLVINKSQSNASEESVIINSCHILVKCLFRACEIHAIFTDTFLECLAELGSATQATYSALIKIVLSPEAVPSTYSCGASEKHHKHNDMVTPLSESARKVRSLLATVNDQEFRQYIQIPGRYVYSIINGGDLFILLPVLPPNVDFKHKDYQNFLGQFNGVYVMKCFPTPIAQKGMYINTESHAISAAANDDHSGLCFVVHNKIRYCFPVVSSSFLFAIDGLTNRQRITVIPYCAEEGCGVQKDSYGASMPLIQIDNISDIASK